jgi:hypothetical protein
MYCAAKITRLCQRHFNEQVPRGAIAGLSPLYFHRIRGYDALTPLGRVPPFDVLGPAVAGLLYPCQIPAVSNLALPASVRCVLGDLAEFGCTRRSRS